MNLLLVEPLGQADIDSGVTDPTTGCPALAPKRATISKRLEVIHLCSNISQTANIQLIRTDEPATSYLSSMFAYPRTYNSSKNDEPATGYFSSAFASTNSMTPTRASLRNRCAVHLPVRWFSRTTSHLAQACLESALSYSTGHSWEVLSALDKE